MTATRVTFDADDEDLTGSEPDDETATMFQSVLTVDSDTEEHESMTIDIDKNTDDDTDAMSDAEADACLAALVLQAR